MPTPQDALNYAKRYVGNMPVDDTETKYRLLDDAHAKFWMAAPWRWTLGSLEVVTVVNDQQDYDLAGTYTDLLYVVHAAITEGETRNDLSVAAVLPSTSVLKGIPKSLQYIAGTPNKIRLLPVPTGYPTTAMPRILGTYKKKYTEITAANYTSNYETTFGIPAEWFWVYQEIVLLKAMQFAHDPRLGGVGFGGNVSYSGQYGAVEAAIQEMRMAEKKFFDSLGMVVEK